MGNFGKLNRTLGQCAALGSVPVQSVCQAQTIDNSVDDNDSEIDNERCFIRVKAYGKGPKGPSSYLTALPDTGNRSTSLMSESAYRKLCPDFELADSDITIVQADKSSFMSTLGRAKKPITLQFYNEKRQKVFYQCRPTICRNLQLPLILSNEDLVKLKLVVRLHEYRAEITVNNKLIYVPLVKHKEIPKLTVTAARNTKIPAFSEAIIEGVIETNRPKNELVEFVPNKDFQERYGLLCCSSLDKVRQGNKVRIRVANFSDEPVTVTKHVAAGEIIFCSEKNGFVYENETLYEKEKEAKAKESLRSVLSVSTGSKKAKKVAKEHKKPAEISIDDLRNRLMKDLKLKDNSMLSDLEKKKLVNLFIKYAKVLALEYRDIGNCQLFEVEINTGDAKPIKHKMRPAPPHLKADLRAQLDRWLTQGVIEPCFGSWASCLVPVGKPDGSIRWCADFRALNKVIKPDARSVPSLPDKLRMLKSGKRPIKCFTTIDLSEAFHSLSIKKEDREKAAFITEFGLYQFSRMPFGLSMAPNAFCHVVQNLEDGLHAKDPNLASRTLCYFDDIILASENFDELFYNLESLLEQLERLGLKIKPSKVEIAKPSVTWLGVEITPEGQRPCPKRTSALRNWKRPTDQTSARKLSGYLNIFRKWIRGYASRTNHIVDLTKQENPKWDKHCEAQFRDIVDTICKGPLLRHADFSENSNPFIVTVDSSSQGIGSTLSQIQTIKDPDGNMVDREVIISYASRRKKAGELHYGSYKSELLGVVDAVHHFKEFLLGRKFKIRSDNKGLKWLTDSTSDKMPALAQRWKEMLTPYNFEIEWAPATSVMMQISDGLSRKPYEHYDFGEIRPCPIRDEMFPFGDLSPQDASNTSDETWTPYFKKTFRDISDPKAAKVSERRKTASAAPLVKAVKTLSVACLKVVKKGEETKPKVSTPQPSQVKQRPPNGIKTTCKALTRNMAQKLSESNQRRSKRIAERNPSLVANPPTVRKVTKPNFSAFQERLNSTEMRSAAPHPQKTKRSKKRKAQSLSPSPGHPRRTPTPHTGPNRKQPKPGNQQPGTKPQPTNQSVRGRSPAVHRKDKKRQKFNKSFSPNVAIKSYNVPIVNNSPPYNECPEPESYDLPSDPTPDPDSSPRDKRFETRDLKKRKQVFRDRKAKLYSGQENQQILSKHFDKLSLEGEEIGGLYEVPQPPELIPDDKDVEYDSEFGKHWKGFSENWSQQQFNDPATRFAICMVTKSIFEHNGTVIDFSNEKGLKKEVFEKFHVNEPLDVNDAQRNAECLIYFRQRKAMIFDKNTRILHRVRIQSSSETLPAASFHPMVIPQNLRRKVLMATHDALSPSFHRGYNITKNTLKGVAYWPNMDEDIRKYIEGCGICQDKYRRNDPELGRTVSNTRERLQVWSTDVIYMPENPWKYLYMVTFTDLATRYMHAYPMKLQTADAIAEGFRELTDEHGPGLVFESDNAPAYRSKELRRVVQSLNCTLRFKASYNPKSLYAERRQGAFKSYLNKLLLSYDYHESNWIILFKKARRFVNHYIDESGTSAYFRMTGRQPNTFLTQYLNMNPENAGPHFANQDAARHIADNRMAIARNEGRLPIEAQPRTTRIEQETPAPSRAPEPVQVGPEPVAAVQANFGNSIDEPSSAMDISPENSNEESSPMDTSEPETGAAEIRKNEFKTPYPVLENNNFTPYEPFVVLTLNRRPITVDLEFEELLGPNLFSIFTIKGKVIGHAIPGLNYPSNHPKAGEPIRETSRQWSYIPDVQRHLFALSSYEGLIQSSHLSPRNQAEIAQFYRDRKSNQRHNENQKRRLLQFKLKSDFDYGDIVDRVRDRDTRDGTPNLKLGDKRVQGPFVIVGVFEGRKKFAIRAYDDILGIPIGETFVESVDNLKHSLFRTIKERRAEIVKEFGEEALAHFPYEYTVTHGRTPGRKNQKATKSSLKKLAKSHINQNDSGIGSSGDDFSPPSSPKVMKRPSNVQADFMPVPAAPANDSLDLKEASDKVLKVMEDYAPPENPPNEVNPPAVDDNMEVVDDTKPVDSPVADQANRTLFDLSDDEMNNLFTHPDLVPNNDLKVTDDELSILDDDDDEYSGDADTSSMADSEVEMSYETPNTKRPHESDSDDDYQVKNLKTAALNPILNKNPKKSPYPRPNIDDIDSQNSVPTATCKQLN